MPDRALVVLSNRLPFTIRRTARGLEVEPSAGGLVSAMDPSLRRTGGTWIGWPGIALRDGETLPTDDLPYPVCPVPMSDLEVQHFYEGFSNGTLWPLFHSLPERAQFDPRNWNVYHRVNRRYAEAALSQPGANSLFWVHDYQLLLVPGIIRQSAPDARLAFFLHIPFPPYDIFRVLPWDRELLYGILGCDLIGFHVAGYARNFLDCVERRLNLQVDYENMVVELGGRAVQVGAFPIGIDYDAFADGAESAPPSTDAGAERVVLGVDRLDYTKGIPERIRAWERLLELYPEHREKVVLLQVAVPSRAEVPEYRALKREIDELVGQVNGRYATAQWSPIRYLYRTFPHEELVQMYRDAAVAVVTPLRDGMNLVAKEYVAAQRDEPGVLVLSRLAGAAETMHEALLVNPNNIDETAAAINRALTMEEPERRSRMAALQQRERRHNVVAWGEEFVEAAQQAHATPRMPSGEDFSRWLRRFIGDHRVALFLDYDGTLTPLVDHPDHAVLSPEMHRVVETCAHREDTDVAIISGRSVNNVAAIVDIPDLIYAGNHGLQIVGPGMPHFRHEDLQYYQDRMRQLAKELQPLATDGAWVEEKGPTLTFHVRAVSEPRSSALAEDARRIISEAGLQPRDAHAAVEARPPIGWDKGRAVLHVLRERYGAAWSERVRVIYIGDDETDEDAFRFLSGLAITFRVGSPDLLTSATRHLPNVEAVRALVEWLATR